MTNIGILPTYNENKKRPFLDTFSFVNNYVAKIEKNGGVPMGIVFPNGKFNEKLLKPYSGLIIPGGSKIHLYHILSIHYAITNDIPLLGICMGMQAIGIYSNIVNEIINNNEIVNYKSIIELCTPLDESKYLKSVSNHNEETIFFQDSINKSSHKIYIVPNTILYKIYNQKTILEPSIHNYVLKEISDTFIINAKSKENCKGRLLNNVIM